MDLQLEPSRLIGPEDVRPGIYVTVSHETFEFVPRLHGKPEAGGVEPIRVTFIPHHAGRPFKVVSVCLPFVLVKDPWDRHHPFDLRCHRLARLSASFGKTAFKRMRMTPEPSDCVTA